MTIAFFICLCIYVIGTTMFNYDKNNRTLRDIGLSLEWFAIGGEAMYIVWKIIMC